MLHRSRRARLEAIAGGGGGAVSNLITTFEEYDVDTAVETADDWELTLAGQAGIKFFRASVDAESGVLIRGEHTIGQNTGVGWSRAGSFADGQILVRARHDSPADEGPGVCFRSALGGTYGTGYMLHYRDGTGLRLSQSTGASHGIVTSVAFTLTTNVWHWIRAEAIGTAVRGKIWVVGDPEPEWMIDVVNEVVPGAGLWGLSHGAFNPEPNREYDYLEVVPA